jgi:uncharacterized protein
MDLILNVKEDVFKLLKEDKSGHGIDHINRVLDKAIKYAKIYQCDLIKTSLIALLHDVDDYKIFNSSQNEFSNAKKILDKYHINFEMKEEIIQSISEIGFNKRLDGIIPSSIECQIVSDCDMLDSLGAIGLIRTIQFSNVKNIKIFDSNIFPREILSSDDYKDKNNQTTINHFFEKLLKIKDLILLDKIKEEAYDRYLFLISFLEEYFKELDDKKWLDYLNEYLNKGVK